MMQRWKDRRASAIDPGWWSRASRERVSLIGSSWLASERIALESNRGAIAEDHGERVYPLGQTKESVFSQP